MRRGALRTFLSALAVLVACHAAVGERLHAQEPTPDVIRGVVVDTSGHPVALAQVSADRDRSTLTDSTGAFTLRIRGDVPEAIEVRRIGYLPVRRSIGAMPDSALRVVLVPMSAAMDPVRAQADYTVRSLELRGFYDRLREKERGANTGHFLTPEDVDKRNTSKVTILVDGIPGVRLVPYLPCSRGCLPYVGLYNNRRCPMTVYLDGTRLNLFRRDVMEPVDIDNVLNARDIAGVEVYTRSNAPDRYRSLAGNCGVVLLWTK